MKQKRKFRQQILLSHAEDIQRLKKRKLIPGRPTLLCEAQHNSVYLIMVVMRRTDVKTAPGEDSWRSCFT